MEDSMMAEVSKVNAVTTVVIFLVGANLWLQKLAGSAGFDALEIDGVDVGQMLGEDGLIAWIIRVFSFLPFF